MQSFSNKASFSRLIALPVEARFKFVSQMAPRQPKQFQADSFEMKGFSEPNERSQK